MNQKALFPPVLKWLPGSRAAGAARQARGGDFAMRQAHGSPHGSVSTGESGGRSNAALIRLKTLTAAGDLISGCSAVPHSTQVTVDSVPSSSDSAVCITMFQG